MSIIQENEKKKEERKEGVSFLHPSASSLGASDRNMLATLLVRGGLDTTHLQTRSLPPSPLASSRGKREGEGETNYTYGCCFSWATDGGGIGVEGDEALSLCSCGLPFETRDSSSPLFSSSASLLPSEGSTRLAVPDGDGRGTVIRRRVR